MINRRKKTKAFTLIELLAVIAILGLLSAIVYPSIVGIINQSKEDAYDVQIKEIKNAASKWAYKNATLLPVSNGDTITIYLGDLKRAGLIDQDLTNPLTSIKFPNDMEILVIRSGAKYKYDVKDKTGTDTGEVVMGVGSIILKGLPYEYVEVGTTYTDPGAIAINKAGTTVPNSSIVKTIRYNGTTVSTIDMQSLKKYEITYSFTEAGKTISVKRNVQVRDTTPPVLTIPTNSNISVTTGSYGLKDGVKAVDNYDGDITSKMTVQGNLALGVPGVYIITYQVTDTSGNTRTKKRTITISGDICTVVRIKGSVSASSYTNKDVVLTASTANGKVPESTTYQWQKVINGVWTNIAGATGRTFTETAETTTRYRVKYNQFNCDSASNDYALLIDKTPPTCTLANTGTTGNNGWYRSNVTVSFTNKNDTGGSGLASYGLSNTSTAVFNSVNSNTQGQTAGQTWYGFVKDKAGNIGTCTQTMKVDTVAPTCASSGGNGSWTNGYRTLTGTCADNLSGCTASSINTGTKYSTSAYNAFNSTTESPGTVYDNAGNSVVCPGNQTVRIDRIAPQLTIVNPKENIWTNANVTFTLNGSDSLSGVDRYEWWNGTQYVLYGASAPDKPSIVSVYSEEGDRDEWARVVDKAGNVIEKKSRLKIDKTAYTPWVSSVGNGSLSCSSNLTTAARTCSITNASRSGLYFNVTNSDNNGSGLKMYGTDIWTNNRFNASGTGCTRTDGNQWNVWLPNVEKYGFNKCTNGKWEMKGYDAVGNESAILTINIQYTRN
ncbi:MAG: DUF5011 domain-containing protein [Bacilli bacterium]|nr:DUF5011 domain-containing protein [Bacilli bacterium]